MEPQSNFRVGQFAVSNTTPTQFSAAELEQYNPKQRVRLKNPKTNTGVIYVGVPDVSSSDCWPLSAGEEIELYINSIKTLFFLASVNNEKVAFLIE